VKTEFIAHIAQTVEIAPNGKWAFIFEHFNDFATRIRMKRQIQDLEVEKHHVGVSSRSLTSGPNSGVPSTQTRIIQTS
jgi:hypothetical protein